MRRLLDWFRKKKPSKSTDERLDEALMDTFPASDPPAMTDPNVRVGQRRPPKSKASGRA